MLIKSYFSKQRGSVMLESLVAILIFSMGILALVALLGASVKNVAAAKYRTEASLLANQVIGEMWIGDKTNATLVADYGVSGQKYEDWKGRVIQTLPGIVDAAGTEAEPIAGRNLPTILVDPANSDVTVTVFWQAPGESGNHNYVAVTRIRN
jgi:type IV pilus assembly protein PilV